MARRRYVEVTFGHDWSLYPGYVWRAYEIAKEKELPLKWYTKEQIDSIMENLDPISKEWSEKWGLEVVRRNYSCPEFRCMGYEDFRAFVETTDENDYMPIIKQARLGDGIVED